MVAMTLIVYADFDSPEGYLASRRAGALVAAGVAVDWRAVQRRPAWPVTGTRIAAEEQEALARRFEELDALLLPGEPLPRVAATLAPNTEAAVSAYAEAYETVVADDVRRLLFDLYWTEGADIGNPNVLRTPLAGPMLRANAGPDSMRQAGYAVSVSRGPITTNAYRRINAWRDEWEQLGSPTLPVVLVDGATLVGADAVRRLGKEIVYRGADVNPDLENPRRYPAVEGRPSPAWVSQIGGRWRHLYKLPATA
jgi:2-hydroxychromene-2-carboxylate isomerase